MPAGHSLVEALAALATGSLLASIIAGTTVLQIRSATAIAARADVAEATSLAHAILAVETRDVAATDIVAIGPDSLALRAHRATAIVCDTAAGRVVVRWAGPRGPDPDKDSALVLRPGREHTVPIRGAATAPPDACVTRTGERLHRMDLGEAARPGDVLLIFEHGAYHLTARALRWRAGAAGRQPLTTEVFDDAGTGFAGADPLTVTIRPRRHASRPHTIPLRKLERAGPP